MKSRQPAESTNEDEMSTVELQFETSLDSAKDLVGDSAGCACIPITIVAFFMTCFGFPILSIFLLCLAYLLAMIGTRYSVGPGKLLTQIVMTFLPFIIFMYLFMMPAIQQARE